MWRDAEGRATALGRPCPDVAPTWCAPANLLRPPPALGALPSQTGPAPGPWCRMDCNQTAGHISQQVCMTSVHRCVALSRCGHMGDPAGPL